MLLRKRHKDLQGLGVQVLGISVDHLPSLRVFDKAQSEFPFPLAADWHRGICRAYGIFDDEKQVAHRTLALYDSQGSLIDAVVDFDPDYPEGLDRLIERARLKV